MVPIENPYRLPISH